MIGGVAAGWIVAGTPRYLVLRRDAWREAVLFGALGALPDLDLLVGAHREPTHSIGAAAIVGLLALAILKGWRLSAIPWFAAACSAAYGSHILLDWLSTDTSPPFGVMALWPFSRAYYESDLHLFMAISRRYYQPSTFIVQNVLAVGWELAILLPLVALIGFLRPRRIGVPVSE